MQSIQSLCLDQRFPWLCIAWRKLEPDAHFFVATTTFWTNQLEKIAISLEVSPWNAKLSNSLSRQEISMALHFTGDSHGFVSNICVLKLKLYMMRLLAFIWPKKELQPRYFHETKKRMCIMAMFIWKVSISKNNVHRGNIMLRPTSSSDRSLSSSSIPKSLGPNPDEADDL